MVPCRSQPAIQAYPELVSLKAIYSRSLASAESVRTSLPPAHASIELYSAEGNGNSYGDLLARRDIDAVIIALPIPAQPAFVKQALLAGKHVLSEKPIAKDMATAHELLAWYRSGVVEESGATWSVAENFRFLARFRHGAAAVQTLGPVLGFRLRMHALVKPGSKYYETAWRKTPDYQGGFLLDGGVHFIAGIRQLLGPEARMARVSAYTAQLQEHLPPIDTVNATVRLANGSSGTFSVSFGTTFTGVEYVVACENGTVDVGFDKTTVKKGDEEMVEDFPEDKNGVKQEVKAWAESIAQGKPNKLQSPEEALADLEILEAMIKSGESDGVPIDLKLQ
ncbi:hypothetical protein MBLNU459_g3270t1 [Dothideomycetes sp. NU459]